MKNKLRILFKYLKGIGIDSITFRADLENGIQDFELDTTDNYSSSIYDIITDIIEKYEEKLYDLGPGNLSNPNEYFSINGEILPNEGKLVFTNVDYQGYDTEESGTSYNIDDYMEEDSMFNTFILVRNFLDQIKQNWVEVNYSGGGDSGSVHRRYETETGYGVLPDYFEEICYNLLEEYGGWEINEGSQGNIMFTKNEIDIIHEWNTQQEYDDEINIVITTDTFSE